MTALLPIDRLLFPEPVTAGLNYLVLASFAYQYRGTNEHLDPITVTTEGDYYRIADGRHRTIGSIIAGRKTVLATILTTNGDANHE